MLLGASRLATPIRKLSADISFKRLRKRQRSCRSCRSGQRPTAKAPLVSSSATDSRWESSSATVAMISFPNSLARPSPRTDTSIAWG